MRISQIVLWSYFTANNLGGEGSGGGGCMSPNQKGAIFILQINKLFFFFSPEVGIANLEMIIWFINSTGMLVIKH